MLELQWELNQTGYWFGVTVGCWTTIFTWEVLLEAPASMQWCRAGLSGSAAVTKTLFYMLRVNSARALPLVALPYNICSAFLALGRQGKLWGHTQRIGDGQGWVAEQDGGILFQWRRGAQPVWFWITKRRVSSCEPELEQPQAKLNSLWNRSEQWLCFTG